MQCRFCNKLCKNHNSKINHERLCKLNESRQIIKSNFIAYNQKKKLMGIKTTNQFTKAKELGQSNPKHKESTKIKLSQLAKGRKHSDDFKIKHSSIMQQVVLNNPESYSKLNVSGRVRRIKYKNHTLKGNWEYMVAQWLDGKGIDWLYEFIPVPYFWNGERKYFPDFYLPRYGIFIEVKGYETERDRHKWQALKNIIVIKKQQIEQIKVDKYQPPFKIT